MSKEQICKCGHPKSWHRIDGVCLRTMRHGSMGAMPSCNCQRFKLNSKMEKNI